MPTLSRVLFFGLQAVAFLVTVGPVLVPLSALATPVPLPMPVPVPLMPHIADYASRTPVKTSANVAPVSLGNSTSLGQPGTDSAVVEGTPPGVLSGVRRRADPMATLMAYVNILGTSPSIVLPPLLTLCSTPLPYYF